MLHAGILPQHPRWAPFFAGLRTVVVDEMHTYRGVFGSHVANVLRRLRRICRFYGSDPQFILTSATIGNPGRLAEQLAEAPVTLVEPRENGAPQGERVVLLYNPPVIDESLALRRSNWLEAVDLGQELLARDVQTIIFAGSRLGAELVVTELQERLHDRRGVRGYRAGYLATERRQIEAGLRAGKIRGVVATSALELGIDIGRLDAALLIGYPGTIASTWQQLGRAGRRQGVSLGVLVAGASPLDQYLMLHPEYLFERSPEQALINPDNDVILANHLLCAAAELPFADGEAFGAAVAVPETLRALAEAGELFERAGRYYWAGEGAPAMAISLRSGSPDRVLIQSRGERGEPQLIGEIDRPGVAFLLYPGAIYLHGGETYLVEELEWEQGIAYVEPVSVDYYTRPMTSQEVQVLSEQATQTYGGGEGEAGSWRSAWGDVRVTLRCTGYRQIRKNTHEVIAIASVELPEHVLDTTACWLELSAALVEELKAAGDWLSDPNEYGPRWTETRNAARARDGYHCQICNAPETPGRPHHVHHRVPLRAFTANPALRGDLPAEMAWVVANRLDNLVTLCPSCHHRAEAGVRLRSGLGGATNLLAGVAPLYLMCGRARPGRDCRGAVPGQWIAGDHHVRAGPGRGRLCSGVVSPAAGAAARFTRSRRRLPL